MSYDNTIMIIQMIRVMFVGFLAAIIHPDVDADERRIILMPVQGKMMCNAVVPNLSRQVFGLGIPETIGCRERMWLVNHSDVTIQWHTDSESGVVSTKWSKDELMEYHLNLLPGEDYVDLEIAIKNQSDFTWHDVFAFNCVSPARAPDFEDSGWMILSGGMRLIRR